MSATSPTWANAVAAVGLRGPTGAGSCPKPWSGFTHLRDCLGIAYQHVVNTGEPVVVQRTSGRTSCSFPPGNGGF